jgi:hypothetical protein
MRSLAPLTLFLLSHSLEGAAIRGNGTRRLNDAYNGIIQLLNDQFNATNCETTMSKTSTKVVCTRPGAQATFTANGTENPTPMVLEICPVGLAPGVKAKCSKAKFYNDDTAILQAEYLVNGCSNKYGALLGLLNHYFQDMCTTKKTKDHVYVECTRPGGQTTLMATRGTCPTPTELKVCPVGLAPGSVAKCSTLTFKNQGKVLRDAKQFLGGVSRRTSACSAEEYNEIVDLLESKFSSGCETKNIKDHTTVTCTRPGGQATFKAKGECPENLTVRPAGLAPGMEPKCSEVRFKNDGKSLDKAKEIV